MNTSGGFISIDRKIVDWEWYKDTNTKVLFLHLLFIANWKDGRFKGYEVPRGSVVTSIAHLARDTGLTCQQVKTALKHLQNTGEITRKSTNKFTLVTLVKYGFYQDPTPRSNKQTNKQLTNKQQTTNKQSTTIEQYNNNNNSNNKNSSQEKEIFSPELVAQWAAEWNDPFGTINPVNYYTYIEGMTKPNRKKAYFESWCRNVKHLVKISELNEAAAAAPASQGTSGTLQKRSAEEMSGEEWLAMMAEQERKKNAQSSEEGDGDV